MLDHEPSNSVQLSAYDGKRIAVVINRPDLTRVVLGRARFAVDKDLGQVLRIGVEDDSAANGSANGHKPILILHQDLVHRELIPDDRYECDFRFELVLP